MSVALETLVDPAQVEAIAPEWEALAAKGGEGAFFRSPTWLLPWFRHFAPPMEAELVILTAREEGVLVGLAPLYERTARLTGGVKVREIRLLGDAGPRPPALDLLAAPGSETRVARAFAEALTARTWDVLDLAPLRDPSRVRAYLAERLDAAARKVTTHEAGTSLSIMLSPELADTAADLRARVYEPTPAGIEKGLVALRRLSRLEWGARDESSPLAEGGAIRLCQEVTAELAPKGRARLTRYEDTHGEAVAVALVIDDGTRAACVALAVDPEAKAGGLLLAAEAAAAAARGLRALDVVIGAHDVDAPLLPTTPKRSLRLRAFSGTTAAALARTYASFRRRAEAAREAPGAAAAGARAAWAKIVEAAAGVATVERLHLYRGQLWTRGIKPPDGLVVSELGEAEYDTLSDDDKQVLAQRLELHEPYCREKWHRGDLVVLARLGERPAGIAWCARSPVMVPELSREVRPGPSECYIHDVFVSPDARGKNVAPTMLEDLARRLRQRDVYRAWALIHPSNVASTRAFEKAAYVSVADVILAKMAGASRVVVRPPDPEARRLFGVTS
jgi:GNAT superfamily N-acetyltransferase